MYMYTKSAYQCLILDFCYTRCVPVTAPPPLISMTAHALSGRRYDTEFQQWFVPEYQHGRGRHNLTEIALKVAEFLVDLFAVVWNIVGQTTKVPNGSRKYQVT